MRQAHVLPPKFAWRVAREPCRRHRSRETGAPSAAAQGGRKTVPLRTWCAHDEAHARTGTVPKESDARRTNRPERIAARWAAGGIVNESAAAEPKLEAADGERDQVRRHLEPHRSRRREGGVIVRRAATLRSAARTGRTRWHVVRLGGNLLRGRLSWHEARPQALHVVAARIRGRTAGKQGRQADCQRKNSHPTHGARLNLARGKRSQVEHTVRCKVNQRPHDVKEISSFVQLDRIRCRARRMARPVRFGCAL